MLPSGIVNPNITLLYLRIPVLTSCGLLLVSPKTLCSCHPINSQTHLFPEKEANFCIFIFGTRKNEIIIVQQKHKHNELAFLMSRNASKHVLWLLVLIVETETA